MPIMIMIWHSRRRPTAHGHSTGASRIVQQGMIQWLGAPGQCLAVLVWFITHDRKVSGSLQTKGDGKLYGAEPRQCHCTPF